MKKLLNTITTKRVIIFIAGTIIGYYVLGGLL